MGLRDSAKKAAERNDRLTLAIGESSTVIVDLGKNVRHIKNHKLGFKVMACTGKGCVDCARGDNPPERWEVDAEAEDADGEIRDIKLAFFNRVPLDLFANALPERDTGKCRMVATGVGAVRADGAPSVDDKTGNQYVNLTWAIAE